MYRYNTEGNGLSLRRSRASGALGAVVILFEYVGTWRDRRRQRFALARLDDRMLRDIGLTTVDVEAELDKPFWR